MRGTVLAIPLALALLAGCISSEPELPTDPGALSLTSAVDPGQYQPHPAYGFPTNGMLPLAENGTTRTEQVDGMVQWYRPVGIPLPDPITGMSEVTHVDDTATGGGIAVFGPLAFIGQRTQGPLQIINISDPTKPKVVGEAADVPVRDADAILYPDGRLVVITTAGGDSQFATDVTDPAAPKLLASITTDHGNHNIAVVPGTPVVYNSGSGGMIDIVDYTDPENPVAAGTFDNGAGCHDITFYIDATKQRAYCAAYGESQIWDIADPKAPKMIVGVPFPSMEQGLPGVGDGAVPDQGQVFPLSFSHLTMVNHDATVLIVGDETGGGGINGCDVNLETPAGGMSGPIGNLWFYDISDEKSPELRSHISPSAVDAVGGSCTAHFGRLLEDSGMLVMGFYAAGVVLVDFNDIGSPRIVERLDQGGSIWDAQYQQGYLFTGDMSRGMDVLKLV